jgi:energy-coupling factor transport system permease protein
MRFAFRRDVALGRYLALDSPVHRLDPRTSLLAFVVLTVVLWRAGAMGSALLVAAVAGVAVLARIPARCIAGALRSLAWILLLTFFVHLLLVEGGSAESGARMVCRIVGMALGALVLTSTTEPVRLADGFSSAFGFLRRVGVPVRDLAMVLMLALRFLPTMMEEAERIVQAQRARGAVFGGGPVARARSLVPLAVPLLAGCLLRADTLALAMEARGYSSDATQTRLHPLAFRRADALVLAGAAVTLAASLGGSSGGS